MSSNLASQGPHVSLSKKRYPSCLVLSLVLGNRLKSELNSIWTFITIKLKFIRISMDQIKNSTIVKGAEKTIPAIKKGWKQHNTMVFPDWKKSDKKDPTETFKCKQRKWKSPKIKHLQMDCLLSLFFGFMAHQNNETGQSHTIIYSAWWQAINKNYIKTVSLATI